MLCETVINSTAANIIQARKLCTDAGVTVGPDGCYMEDVHTFRIYVGAYMNAAIVIYKYDKNAIHTLLYDGKNHVLSLGVPHRNIKIFNIVYYAADEHFDPIEYMHTFMNNNHLDIGVIGVRANIS